MNKYRYPRVPNRRKRRFHFALTWIATGWRGANETPDISRYIRAIGKPINSLPVAKASSRADFQLASRKKLRLVSVASPLPWPRDVVVNQ
ncbi:uncharacterized protein LOC143207993 isoform X2 [Lasioglossum baleicum]|uniref:uncharacterized protein LOC143207993 isoform X2 n=1 Tax=Lasioglossum baleicum TaxID=434251 RepID=UPI003FCCD2F2